MSVFDWAQFQRTKGAIKLHLLPRYLQLRAKFSWPLSNLVAMLRQQLFVHRDPWKWLHEPFEPLAGLPETALKQLALPLAARR